MVVKVEVEVEWGNCGAQQRNEEKWKWLRGMLDYLLYVLVNLRRGLFANITWKKKQRSAVNIGIIVELNVNFILILKIYIASKHQRLDPKSLVEVHKMPSSRNPSPVHIPAT